MKKHGITLIEFLVVVAMITILASIVMPALARVREVASRDVCVSNLQKIGMMVLMYASDERQQLPWFLGGAYLNWSGNFVNEQEALAIVPACTEWIGVLGTSYYKGDWETFMCPSGARHNEPSYWGWHFYPWAPAVLYGGDVQWSENNSRGNQHTKFYPAMYQLLTNHPMVTAQFGETIDSTKMPGDSIIGGDRVIGYAGFSGSQTVQQTWNFGLPGTPFRRPHTVYAEEDSNHLKPIPASGPLVSGKGGAGMYPYVDFQVTLKLNGDVDIRKAGELKWAVDQTLAAGGTCPVY